jgi:translocation and assembly module TamA
MNPSFDTRHRRREIALAWLWATALVTLVPVGAQAASVECRLDGVSDPEILKNIESTLSIIRDQDRDDLTPLRIAQLHERAPMEIRRAVEPFGYYRAEIEASLTGDKKDRFDARYAIVLGEPVRVREVTVSVTGEGKDQPPFPRLVAEFPLKAGDVLDQRSYEKRKIAFASAAADSGFLDAHFTTGAIRIHRDENVADVEMVLDTGPRYRFGPVTFDSTSVDDRVMRAYLTFKPGDPFRYDRLLAFQSALGGAPYFSRVEAVAQRDSAVGHEVPIHVKLSPRRPRRYEIGVGYGTDTGPRILLGAESRRLNRAGHRYSGRVNVSEIELSLNAEYIIPSLYPHKHTYTFGALAAHIDPDAYTTDRLAVGPTRSQPRFGCLESITLSYEYEDYTVGSDDGITNLFIGGITYRLKRADDDIAPTRGQRLDLGLRGADEALLSSQSFLSFTASAKAVRSPTGRLRLIARVDGGVTTTPTFRELPPTIRFFAGGDNSVRGYDYQTLGPLDDDGHVIGGHLLLTTSAEVQVALKGKFGLAGFYDAGNAFARTDAGVMEQGAGGGLRWQSPVGPIRLDLAYPLQHDGWRVHFTMGPDL